MQKSTSKEIVTVKVDGIDTPVLVANMNEGQRLALVDQGVLEHLISLLPKISLADMKQKFIQRVVETSGVEEFTELLYDELAFRVSVDIIRNFYQLDKSGHKAIGEIEPVALSVRRD